MHALSLLCPVVLALPSTCLAAWQLTPKQVAAPAEDLLSGRLRLPDLEDTAMGSSAAVIEVNFTGGRARVELPVTGGLVSIGTISEGSVQVEVAGALLTQERAEFLQAPFAGYFGQRFAPMPAQSGQLTLEVSGSGHAWILVADASPARGMAWLTTHRRTSDRAIGIRARLDGTDLHADRAWIQLDGLGTLPMFDDGQSDDGAAGDGLFGGSIPQGSQGALHGQVELIGQGPTGPFLRSVPLAFHVHEPRAALLDVARTRPIDERRLAIELVAWPLGEAAKMQVSAEVWGHDALGREVPVCWLSRMVEPLDHGTTWSLPLQLDGEWLNRAQARPPLELRDVRLQDPNTHAVLDLQDRIALPIDRLPPVVGRGSGEITVEMLTGSATAAGPQVAIGPTAINPALMLVHGYCSNGTPWPAASFSEPKQVFFDPDQNRSHDEFALLLAQQASNRSSFGVVAHSQGGSAALHLLTYYQSPLDLASGGRRIQSLATPYQGTPLASLGGFACGVNDDMTPAGAATWLAGIPSWARAEVWYWTVSDGGSACNFLASLFLSGLEDGTIEVDRGQLPGATSMGNTTGWCHTTGMTYPACVTDAVRNVELDAQAAR